MSVAVRGSDAAVGRPSGRRLSVGDPPRLPVGGVVPFTAVDFPGKLAAVLFLQGCPWRCAYCHNPHLQAARGDRGIGFGAFLRWLDTRRGLLDAVVFSGGEPTANAGLRDAMREVRDRGFAVGLHTGGAYPRRLDQVLDDADWIGIDVKASPHDYERVTGIAGSGKAARASLRLVVGSGIDHEIRTTVHPALTPDDALTMTAAGWQERSGVRRAEVNAWLLFADPFTMDCERLIESLGEAYPGVPIVGGMASGHPASRNTDLFLDGQLIEDGAVAVAVGGDWTVSPIVSQGAAPIGEAWTITLAEANFIQEIAGRPAVAGRARLPSRGADPGPTREGAAGVPGPF